MSVFGDYARYYDLLNSDKNYRRETDYIHELIQRYAPGSKTILDLGCGTGRHDILLAGKGYSVTGVDMSEEMLSVASTRLPSPTNGSVTFEKSDIRTVRLNRAFDVVISLFHVMSYQSSNEDLLETLSTVNAHLEPGGVFLFDCWYGPAVLSDGPSVRCKRVENEEVSILRIAEPVMHANESVVDVNYEVYISQKRSNTVEKIQETHRMRYLFETEVGLLCLHSGLHLITCREWMTSATPSPNSWSVYFITEAA